MSTRKEAERSVALLREFADTYPIKINPLFSNIEEESKAIAEEHLQTF